MRVICPICGVATSMKPVSIQEQRALLPEESAPNREVYGKAVVYAVTDDEFPHYTSYGIFECQACEKRFVAKKDITDKEWIPTYPIPHRPTAEEIPEPIKSEFEEASVCFAVGAHKACASMCQRVLESLCQNKHLPGLDELLSDGVISQRLFEKATEIRLWAGIIKHKPLSEPVSQEDADELLVYLTSVLDHVYVEPKRLDDLTLKRKQLGRRQS